MKKGLHTFIIHELA